MTLQASGQISFADINIELGRNSTASIELDTAENGGYGAINECSSPFPGSGNPAAISEWYSYNHTASASLVFDGGFDYSSTSCAEACALLQDCPITLYYNTAETAVYTNTTCDTVPSIGYYADCGRTNCYDIVSGIINEIVSCSPPPPPPPPPPCAGEGQGCDENDDCCDGFVCTSNTCTEIEPD
jgi:hypothetical protein